MVSLVRGFYSSVYLLCLLVTFHIIVYLTLVPCGTFTVLLLSLIIWLFTFLYLAVWTFTSVARNLCIKVSSKSQ
jgi:hypothetical protein